MSKFHEVCGGAAQLSQDRMTGRITGLCADGILFSDWPITPEQTFSVRVSGQSPSWSDLPVSVGVTTLNPASRSHLPDDAEDLTKSWVMTPHGRFYKDGVQILERSDFKLVYRNPSVISLTLTTQGSVTVSQDGVAVCDMCTGVTPPVWAVVEPWWSTSVTVLRQENPKCLALVDTYQSTSRPRGYAVIVNVSQVIGLPEIPGTQHDVNRLRDVFTKLHFTPIVLENQRKKVIDQTIESLSQDQALAAHDCFVLVLLSHGGKGYVLAADGGRIDLKETFWLFSNDGCPAMRGKPKLFFIDACRGARRDGGVPRAEAGHDKLPAISDMLVAYPTTADYKAYQDPAKGSRFAQSVADVFDEEAAELDVLHLMTKVTRQVQEKGSDSVQGPIFQSTLNKLLYLCP